MRMSFRASTLLILLTACGANTSTATGTQNPTVTLVDNGAGGAVSTDPVAVEATPGDGWSGRVFLWCSDVRGASCRRVALALGQSPKNGTSIPRSLLDSIADHDDDCGEAGIARIRERLTSRFSLSGWSEQVGTPLPVDSVGSVYTAAGCLSCGEFGVKISGSTTDRDLFLVRVWESC